MEEIKLTPEELKDAIQLGKLIGSGFFSTVFTYKGRLIKLDKELYNLLKSNDQDYSTQVVNNHYRWEKEDFNDREQLEELYKRQPYIRPKVPEGIVTLKSSDSKIDGVSPGIIIHPFNNYENLSKISKNDYKRLLILFKKIFDDLKNLADNEIAQEDIMGHVRAADYNVLQKGNDPQLIDMSGPMIKVGKEFTGPDKMYSEFALLLNQYYQANGLRSPYGGYIDLNETELQNMIVDFEKQIKRK